jgi:hypothetical protein
MKKEKQLSKNDYDHSILLAQYEIPLVILFFIDSIRENIIK